MKIDNLESYYEFEPNGDDVVFDFYMKDGGLLRVKSKHRKPKQPLLLTMMRLNKLRNSNE